MANPNTRGGAIGRRSLVAKAGSVAKKQIAYKAAASAAPLLPNVYPPLSLSGNTNYTWTCPQSGWWKVVIWGPGGSGWLNTSSQPACGGAGGYYEALRFFQKGQTVALSLGNSFIPNNTTATLPSGEVLTATTGGNDGNVSAIGGTGSSSAPQLGDVALTGAAGQGTTTGTGTGGGNGPLGGNYGSGNYPFRGGAPAGIGYQGNYGGGGFGYSGSQSPPVGEGSGGYAIIAFYSL